ncbi:MAG: T9SS type A sorting domain-containing protein, partial [Bacteroidota bacterium]|nr:T9SS type A sorting domain-containing protein [Bacteroidota bacterium]
PGLIVKLNDDDWGTTDHDHIILHKITIDWDTSANSNVELIDIPTAPYDTDGCSLENTGGFSCIPQPNGQGIDGAEWIITNKAQYRNFGTHESFVLSFMVDVTGNEVAGIRWIEMRKTPAQDWFLYQEGTIGSDDGLHRFMSSIGIDGQGNIGVAYSISGESKHPSLRYTGRYATDPLGTMTFKEYEFATGGGSIGTDRFGDYASMSVDPSDDQTFWFSGEYIPTTGNWSTRVVAFAAARDTFDLFPTAVLNPQDGPDLSLNEPLTFRILNRGLKTVYDFSVGYQFEGGIWIIEPATIDSLPVDSSYDHTFSTGLDFIAPGHYTLLAASILDIDGNHLNDTILVDINKPAHKDIAIAYNVPQAMTTVCSVDNQSSIDIRNLGVDTIQSVVLQLLLNGAPVDTIEWTGSLLFGEEEEFLITVAGLVEGDNIIQVVLLTLNGVIDELPDNNDITWTLTAQPEGTALFLNLLTDNFPGETTWELIDDTEAVIAAGGPYAEEQNLFVSAFCLDRDKCYTFVIYDSFGDGMSAQGVQGDYAIVNVEGDMIASLAKPNFGDSEANQFCLTGECVLHLSVGFTPESSAGANDGWALVETTNSLGVVEYSLDGSIFQTSNLFTSLQAGTYMVIARDDAGCLDTASFTILECQLETLLTTLPATGGDVGEIHVSASNGLGPILYSLNGGEFGLDSNFTMLEPGIYVVTTRDSAGCERIDSVFVSTNVSTIFLTDDHFIQIHPNPGKGVYQVEAIFPTEKINVRYTIFSSSGEPVVRGAVGRYDERFKGELSLLAYPAGTYYVVFNVNDHLATRRIIKVE